jgi:hypothetical protein
MADDRWKEFEDLGEDQVRVRLAEHNWSEGTERLARQWLERRETSLAREANEIARKANDVAEKANELSLTSNMIATFALIGAGIAIAISVIALFLKSH